MLPPPSLFSKLKFELQRKLKLVLQLFAILTVLVPTGLFAVEPAASPNKVPAPQEPNIAPASSEGEQALSVFKVPEGFKAELYAAEPLVAHPVCICFDRQGRCYVGETFRQDRNRGVEDNRNHMDWLDEDLAAQTVADRRAYLIRHLGDQITGYSANDDRIRQLEDRDGDGKIDHASVFACGFNAIDEGTGAGLVAVNGSIYYTCIPRLWKLTDKDDDGVADERVALHDGFGVRTAFRGHDMHGLIMGPDGRIYFSMGDRGLNVQTKDGAVQNIETGAVLRCEPDGSNLEVFATGLRNPQELAFDAYGNLFTVDNNSDSGDQARLVQVVDGGDSGWRMAYQYLSDRGPWNREKLWHPQHEGQPAYIVPPIINMANGPSGLVYYPGTGLPEQYNGHFFLCEYRGGATNSGVMSFAVEPNGAGFKQIDEQQFFWSILPSDVEFGPGGELFVTDWVHGWLGQDKGRIYKLFQPEALASKENKEAAELLAGDFSKLSSDRLVELMGHPNMRVRLQAQFAMVEIVRKSSALVKSKKSRGAAEFEPLIDACASESLYRRLHAIWALGQLARDNDAENQSNAGFWLFSRLPGEKTPEVIAQTVRMLGEVNWSSTSEMSKELLPNLTNDSAPVRFQTAIALGKLKATEAVEPLVAMIEANDNADVMLRHAGVMGLTGTATVEQLVGLADHASPAVRLAAVLALRRKAAPEITRFLTDADPFVVEETARAIYDLPIPAALPALADRISQPQFSNDELARRILNANFRLGTEANANAVAKFATREAISEPLRLEAVRLLADWTAPSAKDRLLNIWRPLPTRPADIGKEALRSSLPGLLTSSDAVRAAAAETAAALGLREVGPELHKLFAEQARPAAARVAAFQALVSLPGEDRQALTEVALKDEAPTVRAAGLKLLANTSPEAAFPQLEQAIEKGTQPERQAALGALAALDENQVPPEKIDALLQTWLDKLIAGEVPPEIQLDLMTVAEGRAAEPLKERLATYRAALPQDDPMIAFKPALAGGDAERGAAIFFQRAQLSCVRCHLVGDKGGLVGPELSKIGGEKNREYLLEAIVDPNKTIAKGFQSATVLLDDGRVVGGVIKDENETTLRLMSPDGRLVTIEKDTIEDRQSAKSPMPEDFAKNTTLADLRDLVEFLSSLKAKP